MKSVAGGGYTQGRGPGAPGEAAAEVRALPRARICDHSCGHEAEGPECRQPEPAEPLLLFLETSLDVTGLVPLPPMHRDCGPWR